MQISELRAITQRLVDSVADLLPGNNKCKIYGPSGSLESWYQTTLTQIPAQCDTVIIDHGDVFVSATDANFLGHPSFKNKQVFVITQGYENRQLHDNIWEISLWRSYFRRIHAEKKIKRTGLKPGFLCLNRRVNLARIVLGYKLWNNNLLDQIVFSQHDMGAWWTEPNVKAPMIIDQFADLNKYIATLPRAIDSLQSLDTMNSTEPWMYDATYCNISVESESGDDIYGSEICKQLQIATEKSVKTFVACQIPVFLACPGHYEFLKSFGFEMMEDLLPANYSRSGSYAKIDAIVDLVSRGPEYIEQFYFDHLKEIEHNHALITGDSVEQQIMTNIKNFLNNI